MLSKSLSGIRVLDFTRLFPGPLCTMMLSDLGAAVIKVEAPEGEITRYIPPYQFGSGTAFLQFNRGKRSLTLNLKKQEAAAIVHRLLQNTDVLVESFRPGVMRRFGLDYKSLQERFPSLIYCSISGYGQEGPNAQKPGHDLNYISMAGIVGMSGKDKPVLIPPVQIADVTGAFQATSAITAALFQRTREGRGQQIDISLLDGAFFYLISIADGQSEARLLSGRLACYNIYRTQDDHYLAVALLEPKFWQTFCLKMQLTQYLSHQLQDDQVELIEVLKVKFAQKTLNEWLDFFAGDDLCVTRVQAMDEAMRSAQIRERNMLLNISYPSGMMKQFKTPFSGLPENLQRAPLLGEHNAEILGELGYTLEEIALLKKEGVL